MGRARRARRIASRAAYGGGIGAVGAVGLGVTGWAVLKGEAAMARRIVGKPLGGAPDDQGTYGSAPGKLLDLLVLGDSSAKGLGADIPQQTVGAINATALAAIAGRRVRLTNVAVIGAVSTDLDRQVQEALSLVPRPNICIIMVGANDVAKRMSRTTSVRHLASAVVALREVDAHVVVGTCPDLGVIQPVPQPLRHLARRWSRDLAAAQTVAVVEHGGRTVSLGDLLGQEFQSTPSIMFSKDGFHPSAAGYARAASALLPSVLDSLGFVSVDTNRTPDVRRGEGVSPVSVAATQAAADPGTEVVGTEVRGDAHGRQGRWAVLLRRHHTAMPDTPDPDSEPLNSAAATDQPGKVFSPSAPLNDTSTHSPDPRSPERGVAG